MVKVKKSQAIGASGTMAAAAVEVALGVTSSSSQFLPVCVAWEREGETRF